MAGLSITPFGLPVVPEVKAETVEMFPQFESSSRRFKSNQVSLCQLVT